MSTSAPIRVLLADDHDLVRAGFRALLEALPGVQVVAEAADGLTAVALATQHQPTVALVDIAMPTLNGLDAVARIVAAVPTTAVIMLSMHADEAYVLQALHAGARGYLLKGARTTELEIALAAVVAGQTYLSPAASQHLVSELRHRQAPTEPALTPRQRQILTLVAQGYTTKAIAHALHLSVKTVEMHRTQLMERLDIHDVAGLVRYAVRTGLVSSQY